MSRAALLVSMFVLTSLVAVVWQQASGAGISPLTPDEKLIQAASKKWDKYKKARYKFVFHRGRNPKENMIVVAGNDLTFLENGHLKISPYWELIFPSKVANDYTCHTSDYMEFQFDRPVKNIKDIRGTKIWMTRCGNMISWSGPPEKAPPEIRKLLNRQPK